MYVCMHEMHLHTKTLLPNWGVMFALPFSLFANATNIELGIGSVFGPQPGPLQQIEGEASSKLCLALPRIRNQFVNWQNNLEKK